MTDYPAHAAAADATGRPDAVADATPSAPAGASAAHPLAVDPVTLDGLVRGVQGAVDRLGLGGDELGPVLLATQSIRSPLRQIIARFLPRMAVMSHGELPGGVQVISMETVRLEADAHQAV